MDARTRVAEDIADHYQRLGLSGTAARVLGHLVMSGTGSADAPALAAELGVAKSSLSVALGTLERFGLVTRRQSARDRRAAYVLADDAFERVFLSKLPALEQFLELADRGLEFSEPGTDSERRLTRMREFYAFMLREFPALLAAWRAQAGA